MNYHEEQALKRRLVQGVSLIGVIACMLTIGPVETLCLLVWWGLVTKEK